MSHITTLSSNLCLRASLAADPSPPPIINTVFGLHILNLNCLIKGRIEANEYESIFVPHKQKNKEYESIFVTPYKCFYLFPSIKM